MHIGIDATCWLNNRGYGRHARSLIRALIEHDSNNTYVLYLDAPVGELDLPSHANAHVVDCNRPASQAASANGRRSIRDMRRMGLAMADPRIDVLVFPTIYSFVPVFSRSKKVVVMHDVIAERFPQLTVPRFSARMFWRLKTTIGRWQASALVTVSEHAKRCIVDQFKINPDRIQVVSEASDAIFRVLPEARPNLRLQALGLTGDSRWIAYVGGFSPHKNLEMLLKAFSRIAAKPEFHDVRMVMVGDTQGEVFHSYLHEIRKLVTSLQIGDHVLFTGYLSDEDLVVLLNSVTLLALPSLMEGFGLPAVEAAACGLPVIATTESPLPELLGAGGIFVDPHDENRWQEVLERVLLKPDLREEMSAAGVAAADRISWEAAAGQLQEVISRVTTV